MIALVVNEMTKIVVKVESWEKCVDGVNKLLDLLEEHADVITTGNLILDENEVLDHEPYKARVKYTSKCTKNKFWSLMFPFLQV